MDIKHSKIKPFTYLVATALAMLLIFTISLSVKASALAYSGAKIVEISNQSYLKNLPATTIKVGTDIDIISATIRSVNSQTVTIKDGENSYTQPITIEWDYNKFNTDQVGSFEIVGTVVAPSGVELADDVPSKIVVPFNVIDEPTEPQEITFISNYSIFSKSIVVKLDDNETFDEEIYMLTSLLKSIGAMSDNGDEALLELDYLSTDSVDLSTVGTYIITAKLKVSQEFSEKFYISDELSTVEISVQVISDEQFTLASIDSGQEVIATTYNMYENSAVNVYYIESEFALDDEYIYSNAELADDSIAVAGSGILTIYSSNLSNGKYYYFFLEHEGITTNIEELYVFGTGFFADSDSISGHRDGGDAKGNNVPDYSQDIPSEQDTVDEEINNNDKDNSNNSTDENKADSINNSTESTSNSLEIGSTTSQPSSTIINNSQGASNQAINSSDSQGDTQKTESVTSSYDTLSGNRLSIVMEESEFVTFSKNGITLQIPSESLKAMNIESADLLKVEIIKVSSNSFEIKISLNNNEISELANMTVTLPYSESNVTVADASGKEYPFEYDEVSKTIRFTTDSTGEYSVKGENDNSDLGSTQNTAKISENKFFAPIAIALGCVAVLVIVFIVIKNKKSGKRAN